MKMIESLLDVEHTLAKELLTQCTDPWEAFTKLDSYILQLGMRLDKEYIRVDSDIWVHKTAIITPSAMIVGPCIIGTDTEIRHCAFIRGSVIIGNQCVVGNSVEVKNAILFDNVQIPHYNYVGDSILGYYAHMGAGAITSNVKSDQSIISIQEEGNKRSTGRKKMGSILGDYVEIGCNSVLNPGTIIGRNTSVYPLTSVRGTIDEYSIVKSNSKVVKKTKQIIYSDSIEKFLQVLQLNEKDVIAIDGPCGSGKSTLADAIAQNALVDIIHMDDFYLPLELRTEDRLQECGGNLHYERFYEEVVKGIQSNKEFSYQKFSCQAMDYVETVKVSNQNPIVIEGSYSLRSDFRELYTKKVYLEVDEGTQKARIIKRVGKERYEDFKNVWIPKEKEYLDQFEIKEKADIILKG
ncbi:MAG: hypothetical protein R3Y54_00850 [Eubacteriales bacterium]